ncbi:hypothetical protein Back11_41470 [Paenibacillus baekrokdamisoli]|uniref:Uncharacterized protein n=1 Tax=Paenibacillus baekrokdamisoli TaxID=1712516 RepID=A0A3G9IWX1_9BACL|nr:transposase [Paenibacillus baekrokdamisoli]MBB3068153.1 hypothetical protein [Paenibacillus baekrokdamisoli]BBH22802.1 hypothetical protein Back11_41470 [Paenibacillus baekrokdamisoli]
MPILTLFMKDSSIPRIPAKLVPFNNTPSNVNHTQEGLELFHHFLKEVEANVGQPPTIIFEATSHYHVPVTQFLEEHHYLYVVINPILSYQAKKSSTLQGEDGCH